MTIEFISGDLLDAFDKGDVDAIVHCVNCKGVMGGLAGKIKTRYPKAYNQYLDFIGDCSMDGRSPLGLIQKVSLNHNPTLFPKGKTVVNLFGQEDYGTYKRQINYGALGQALTILSLNLTGPYTDKLTYGFPHFFASNLGGGDWDIVLEMIEFTFRNHNVKIYKL